MTTDMNGAKPEVGRAQASAGGYISSPPLLTRRQRELLDFLRSFVAANGYPPTVRQMGAALGVSSTQTVHAHLARLARKGCVQLGHAHRAIQLLAEGPGGAKPAPAAVYPGVDQPVVNAPSPVTRGERPRVIDGAERAHEPIPLIGRVAAGQPHFALENIEGYVDLGHLRAEERVFALRVKGDSMMEAGILDGDYLLVRPQETAENGDIVVALVRDEATVKVFYRDGNRIRLQPANARMRPILTKQVSIVGKVIASFRGYGAISLISDGV